MEIQSNYVINQNTAAILPEFKFDGAKALVIENYNQFYVSKSPTQIIASSLLQYGSSLSGAKSSSQHFLGQIRRHPIMICSKLEIFFYTTSSMKNHDAVWISGAHTKQIRKINNKRTQIHFVNGDFVEIDGKYKSVQSYYYRCLELKKIQMETIFENQKEKLKEENHHLVKRPSLFFVKDPSSISYTISEVK
ncbi:MAG: competence protein ComK [Bacillales bacterium]|jgi:competence protein ComK|nr:competence protein ComK [Bacillales bacterium]